MRRVYHIRRSDEEHLLKPDQKSELGARVRRGTSDFDFGIEVALTWLGQLEDQLASLSEPRPFIYSVKAVLGDVRLILLEVSSSKTIIC